MNIQEDLVSIIIPVYNVENFIDCCMESVVYQTYQNIEILVMEAESTDKSLDKVMKWSRRDQRMVVVSRKDGGLGPGRNYGMNMAQGEFVVFLDSDDWLEQDYVEKLVEFANQDNKLDIVFSEVMFHYERSGETVYARNSWVDGIYDSNEDKKRIMRYANNSIWGKLYRRSLFSDNHVLQPNLPFEDLAVYLELLAAARKIGFCNQTYINYRAEREGSLIGVKESYLKFPEVMKWSENGLKRIGMYETYKNAFRFTMYNHFQNICKPNMDGNDTYNIITQFDKEKEYLLNHFHYFSDTPNISYWGYGSFSVRWIIHRLHNGKEGLKEHFAFSGIISQMTIGKKETEVIFGNTERERWLANDIEGHLCRLLRERKDIPQLMVMDFIQECQDIFLTPQGNYIAASEILDSSKIPTECYKRIFWESDEFMELWKTKCKEFIDALKEEFVDKQLILIQNYYPHRYMDKGKEQEFVDTYETQNKVLATMYQYFKDNYPKAIIYNIPSEFQYTDVTGQGYENSPIYLNSQAYNYIAERIDTERFM